MKFDVYCDECRPDLLGSKQPAARYMVIGSLWLRTDDRQAFKEAIHALRNKHRIGGEFKWRKISSSRQAFYEELVDWFFEQKESLRFRCIAIDHEKVNLVRYHKNDQELGFYKFYYQMLHHWIMDFNEYMIFCDFKSNRVPDRLPVLRQCLSYANLSSVIAQVQANRSRESVLLQMVDVLTGTTAARLNGLRSPRGCKAKIVERIEQALGRRIGHTQKAEQKFNVFVINLQGGW